MKIVMILVPVMLILVTLGVVLFSWAVKNGQYDDLDGPAHRILHDDDKDLIPDDAKQATPKNTAHSEQAPQGNPVDNEPREDQTS